MGKIHVVGLGPGDLSGLPMGTYQLLESGLPLFLRTERHPVVDELRRRGITFQTFDALYDTGDSFKAVYQEMVNSLVKEVQERGEIVYAVPGHPLMAEQAVQLLLTMDHGAEVVIGPGQSFLDAVCAVLQLDPIDGFLLLDGTSIRADQFQTRLHTLIAQVFSQGIASDVKIALMDVYPDDYPVTVVRAAGVKELERVETVPLYQLDWLDWVDHLTTVFVPASADDEVHRGDPWFVADLVRRLRAPDGCPWDREQTHESLRPYVIEEAYEVAEAIDRDDPDHLADELGDLLLQVLLHAEIASEFGDFQLRDVYRALSDKLIRRHPHVFGSAVAKTEQDAEAEWAKAKAKEQKETTSSDSLLDDVSRTGPADRYALDVQKRVASTGFDWEDVAGVLDKVREEVRELESELNQENSGHIVEEFGDLAFTLINLSRWLKVDFDGALAQATRKFEARFRFVEQHLKNAGKNWEALSSQERDELWDLAKEQANCSFSRHN